MGTLSQQQNNIHEPHFHHHPIMPHGLGLLTTVASLPPKYRSRYLNIKAKIEIPLDLSVKQQSIRNETKEVAEADTGETTESPQLTEPEENLQSPIMTTMTPMIADNVEMHKQPMTPPMTPPKRRKYFEEQSAEQKSSFDGTAGDDIVEENPQKHLKTEVHLTLQQREKDEVTTTTTTTTTTSQTPTTRSATIKCMESPPKTGKSHPPPVKPSKNKATRKLKFDEDTSSPVSGTIIRPLEEITDGSVQYSNGDIDPKYNIVEVTEETKAELAAIRNVIGDYVCKLCRIRFDDAFGLARHRCSCIVLLEYRCPECGKQFNCPANLASHRRWHKPKAQGILVKKDARRNSTSTSSIRQAGEQENNPFECDECGKKFRRQAYLRKHKSIHRKEAKEMSAGNKSTVGTERRPPANSISSSSVRSQSTVSSGSSPHSYEDESVGYTFDYDTMSDCSSSSGRLQIVESHLTEEENIAAAALANLRNCTSVIQHTTVAH